MRPRNQILLMFSLLLLIGAGIDRLFADESPPRVSAAKGEQSEGLQPAPEVTPVTGPSWLDHEGLEIEETDMGQMGGSGRPPRSERREPEFPEVRREPTGMLERLVEQFFALFQSNREEAEAALERSFQLTGADLYRLNCRSCHGPDGKGSPPEIKTLLDPVRGSSPALVMRRMEERGAPIERSFAEELAAEAEQSIRDRLVEGGEKMPPFRHIEGQEVDALLHHLKRLAGAPEEESRNLLVPQSVVRVGEHLVKGTCHICHEATGPGGGHMSMMRGIIPSLESFPQQKSPGEVFEKVRSGRSGMMMMMRSRMPTMPYLTEAEVIAAYLYLATIPPRAR